MNLKSWKEIPIGGIILEPGNSRENKTGSWRSNQPKLDSNKCAKCYNCLPVCPERAIKKDKEGNVLIDYDYCKGCGICAAICPQKAIKL
jgi:pyruvate ferredoxin oxidoreductase delta subunit